MEFAAEPLAEDALLLRFGERIDVALNAKVHAAANALRAANLPGIQDIAPAYASLLLRFDPFHWHDRQDPGALPHTRVSEAVHKILAPANAAGRDTLAPNRTSRIIEFPVCYGSTYGVDLEEIAAHARMTPDEVVARHSAQDYTVAMLGFAPGFPYLLGLDPVLHTPRRATPRTRVPAGSVAIGGAQTGIYPRELPGGWNLIGRTPLMLFDPRRSAPSLLAPGDHVHFRAITAAEFTALAGHAA